MFSITKWRPLNLNEGRSYLRRNWIMMNGHLAIGKLDPFLLFNHGHNIWCPQKIQNNILYWIRIWKVNIGQKTVKLYGSNVLRNGV